MHVISFLLSAVGVALSLVYSGVCSEIVKIGVDLAAMKVYFGSLDPKQLCVIISTVLAVAGALFALSKKRFGSLLLLAASVVCLYCEFKLAQVYPYVRAAACLFAAAAVVGWFRRKDEEPGGNDDWNVVAVPAGQEAAKRSVVAPERKKPAPAEGKASVKKLSRFNFWGLLLALAAAVYSLYMSGLWGTAVNGGAGVHWLKDFVTFDEKTKVVLCVSALSVLGGVFAFFRGTFGTALLCIAAVVCGVTEIRSGAIYPWSWGMFILCLAAAAVAWPGERFDTARAARRYTVSYVYAFVFALAGAALALYMSGIGGAMAVKGCPIDLTSELAALDRKSLAVCAIVAAGLLGAFFALFGARLAVWLLLAAMIGSIAAELRWTPFYACSWVTVLLFAFASMLAGSYVSSESEKIVPAKRLTLHGAFLVAVFAAAVGGALMWSYNRSGLTETLREARANDPAYLQLETELKKRDASIEEMNGKVQEQMDFVAERDKKIADLVAQNDAKDAQIAAMAQQGNERDAQFAALNGELEKAKADLASAQAAANRKYIYVHDTTNVRTVPGTNKGGKILGRLTNAVVEVVDSQRPAGSTAIWYQVKYGNGTAWVYGRNAVVINPKK